MIKQVADCLSSRPLKCLLRARCHMQTKRLPLGLISFPRGDILFDPENDRFLKLNETAIAMWLALSLRMPKRYVLNDVSMSYDVTHQELRKDLKDLIRRSDSLDINPARHFWKIFSLRPIARPMDTPQEKLKYERPEIEVLQNRFSVSKTRKKVKPIVRKKRSAAMFAERKRRRGAPARSSQSAS